MEKTTDIAFLGLGAMGAPMAHRLAAAGYPLVVWNRSAERVRPLLAAGAQAVDTPAQAVRGADIVITMLAHPAAVREVFAAFRPALRQGTRVIDTSSIGPDAVREVAASLPPDVTMIDAPVMGSVDRAAAGTLSLLVGGDSAEIDQVSDLLELFGTVTRCGALGTGAALKLVLITAVITGVTAIGEAMALADALGLPEDLVRQAMAGSPLAKLAGRAFAQEADFPIRLAVKDVALAGAVTEMPLAAAARRLLAADPAIADDDLGRIVKHLRG